MSKPWGGIGAWAADAERAEAEELEQAASAPPPPSSQFTAPGDTFPSLRDSIAAKPKKKKQTMTLSEFTTGTYVGPGGARRHDHSSESKGLTTEEMLRLPTGPKERSADEMDYNRLGGGFRSYGAGGGGSSRGGNREGGDGSWGGGGGGRRSYGGFDDDRRGAPPPRVSDMDQPSRADGVDNWAVGKKSLPLMDSGRQDRGDRDRYSSLGSGGGVGGGSRADDVDNWATGKKPIPVRSTNFGSGFKDSSADGDRWSRGGAGMGGGGMQMREGERGGGERPRLVLNPPRTDLVPNETAKTTSKASPFGAARPREEVLAEKGLDWRQQDTEIETRKTSRPTSSHSSRPGSAHSARAESPNPQIVEKSRPKVNPFGDAKPREVMLEAQGKDWKKMDMELERRGIDRPESEEEKLLKEEIDNLKKELENEATADANGESLEVSGEPKANLNDLVLSRERDLELLTRELDDKVRFSQKATERPGSGAGRFTFSDRPPSSDLPEESRSMEFRDRPRSRGNEAWARPGDDRRAFQSGRERGFPGNNDIDRSRSSGRW